MRPAVKRFIENNIELIENHQFETLYAYADDELETIYNISDLSKTLLAAGINPLHHLQIVPEGYLLGNDDITDIVIPEGIICINSSAFRDCEELIKIVLPSSLTIIEEEAFRGCTHLNEIEFNCIFPSIECLAFKSCNAISTINYAGTIKEWKRLLTDCRETALQSADCVNCSDGSIVPIYEP